jgi:hypothetical protein
MDRGLLKFALRREVTSYSNSKYSAVALSDRATTKVRTLASDVFFVADKREQQKEWSEGIAISVSLTLAGKQAPLL